MMSSKNALLALILLLTACAKRESSPTATPLTEHSDYYSAPVSERLYSAHVGDTFRIFTALPKGYHKDSTRRYPLILLLDANAFFEPTLAELRFNSFIGTIPRAVVVGIGYKDFPTMDSLRSRDLTYPVAIPEYEMALCGGAEKFRKFINDALLPQLQQNYHIDMERTAICGHSLGGYFTLYYGLKSIEEGSYPIRHIVSASPSLHFNNRWLFDMEKALTKTAHVPLTFYVSMGSADMDDPSVKDILHAFHRQVEASRYPELRIRSAEFTNFGHIDAAIPGFIKGLSYSFGQ
ncbi:MAG: alpha/beta hydrolase fold domain-containing protein [Cyclobacteriaceae bacterium]|nr:alpha/beta hydrolase fold domain-containing protein [Cyclobacteriaceae bacterium]